MRITYLYYIFLYTYGKIDFKNQAIDLSEVVDVDKNIRIEEGLKPGTMVYASFPENPDKFRIAGEELIPVIKERARARREEIASTITPIGRKD